MTDKQLRILCYFLWKIATSGKLGMFTFEQEYAIAKTIATSDEEE